MGVLDDLVAPRVRPQLAEPSAEPSAYKARVETAPDPDGLIEVLLDGETTREKPCRYSPVLDTDPAPGDIALVVYDQDGAHYVIAWWPA